MSRELILARQCAPVAGRTAARHDCAVRVGPQHRIGRVDEKTAVFISRQNARDCIHHSYTYTERIVDNMLEKTTPVVESNGALEATLALMCCSRFHMIPVLWIPQMSQ